MRYRGFKIPQCDSHVTHSHFDERPSRRGTFKPHCHIVNFNVESQE